MSEPYYHDYPNEPIGGGNPYYRCKYCKISDPQINGQIKNHAPTCEYRKQKEQDIHSKQRLHIKAWHGFFSSKDVAVIDQIAEILDPGVEWEFNGNIGDFAKMWGRKFLAFPDEDPLSTYNWRIFITQYQHFGQR